MCKTFCIFTTAFIRMSSFSFPPSKEVNHMDQPTNTNQASKPFQKISAATIEAINRLAPDALEAHGIIQRARVSGFVCPTCGSGEGSHGTGMTLNKKSATHTSFHCFSCGGNFNVFRLGALHYGLDIRADYPKLIEKICADFDIPLTYDEFSFIGGRRVARKIAKRTDTVSPQELKCIQDDFNASVEPLKTFMKYQPDQKWRGFDFEFLANHGCRLINNWTHPKTRGTNKQELTPTMRMIVPAGDVSYLARLVDQTKNYDIKARPFIKEKVHAGRKVLFNPEALNSEEPVFCFEGFFDAMSAEVAGFKAVALGGRGEGDLLIAAIDQLKHKPQIIILFDPDKAGRESAPELRDALLQIKCPCVVRFLSRESDSKLDANDILQNQGVDVLRGILQDILDLSLAELNAVEAELSKKDTAGLTDEDWDFIFSGNPFDLTFARRLEKFCSGRVKWLTDSEHWLIFNSSVWQHCSEKNSCVSPFARQLSDAMTQNAESKAERELADRFQSAKKIGSAITLLKSCDSILITADDLNRHNELFCVQNGVVNLQTGELYPLDPTYLITQQSPAIYRPGYRSSTVDNFLKSILPDEATRAALVRFIGYSATGEVIEEKALFLYGPGGNGKGTLTRTVLILFGDYGTVLRPSAVLYTSRPQDAGAATTELNPLENCRLAIIEELPQGGRLDTAKFKNLTGSDFIPIRKLHQEQVYIEPHFSPILSGNYRPELSDTRDPGLLRRLLNIDFTQSFIGNQRDPYLKRKLAEPDSQSGLLSLIVDAAVEWYRDGLLESSAMKQATHDFLHENDFIGEFIDEHCEHGLNLSIPRKAFLERLKKEYPAECLRQFSNRDRALVEAIKRIDGLSYDNKGGTYRFTGIGWRNAPKQQAISDAFSGEPINPRDTPF